MTITTAQTLGTLEEEQDWVPTVGEDCLDNDGDQVTVIATQGGWAWVKLSDPAGFLSPVSMLSPIPARSERELAVEEMAECIGNFPGVINANCSQLAEFLHGLGYRRN